MPSFASVLGAIEQGVLNHNVEQFPCVDNLLISFNLDKVCVVDMDAFPKQINKLGVRGWSIQSHCSGDE